MSRPIALFYRPPIVYVVAVIAVGLALLFRLLIEHFSGGSLAHYITFYPVVMIVALYGGVGPGLLATAVTALVAVYWILPPHGFAVSGLTDAVGLGLFLCMGVFMSLLAELYRRLRQKAAAVEKELALHEGLARAAMETERQRQLLEVTLTSIGDAVIVTDDQGRITFMNREAEKLTGWPRQEAVGQALPTVFRIVNEQTRQPVESPVDKVLRLGAVIGLANHTVLIAKDGRQIPIDDSGAPIRSYDGVVHGVVLVFRDFTQHREAERALAESEERFRTMANAIPQLAWMAQADGYVFWFNRRWYEYTGTMLEQVQGWGWQCAHDPDMLPKVKEKWEGAVASGQPIEMEFPLRGKDGGYRWFLTRAMPLYDASGNVVRWFGTCTDISEKREAQEKLLRSEQRYRSFVEASSKIVWTTNAVGEVEMDIPTWQAFVGQSEQEARGYGWMNVIRPEDRDRVVEAWKKASESRSTYEVEYMVRRHDRVWRNILARGVPVFNDDGSVREYVGTCIDITERKQAEEELQRSRVDLNRAQVVASVGSWRLDVRKNELTWSDEAHRIFGVPAGVPLTYETFLAAVHPEDREFVDRSWQAALRGEPYDIDHRIIVKGMVKWVRERATLEFDSQGKLLGGFGTTQDVTERKRAMEELAAAKVSAEQAKSVAEHANQAKDQFLAILSHELRTPLTPVLAAISMLQRQKHLDEDTLATIDMVRRNIEMEARLIDDLLDLTRIARGKVELHKRPVELGTVIEHAIQVCRPDIEARQLDFNIDITSASQMIEADIGRLQQVFWNLLKNAIKFTPHGGRVGICCRPAEDGHAVVEVNDNGVGIEPAAMVRIFDAFEQGERSVTRQFGGLGLGLAISKSLVEMHGGTIEAFSEGKDRGATFRVCLPIIKDAGPSAECANVQAKAKLDESPKRGLRILIVEDHGDTAEMMRWILESEGHKVSLAGDVSTALSLVDSESFDLMISDLGLPDGSGVDLMRTLRSRGHKLPAIALSGYGQESDIRQSRAAGFAEHMVKPMDMDLLIEAVEKLASK